MAEAGVRQQRAGLGRYRPYPEYKDSGIEWLGQIPAHWEVQRLKTFATVNLSNVDKKTQEGEVPVRLCNYLHVYRNDLITKNMDFMSATATAEQARRFSLERGDVLVTKDSESWTDIAVPAVVADDLSGVVCGYHLALIRPREACSGRFLGRAFSAAGPRHQFRVAANGITRFGLGAEAIASGRFALPPMSEQSRIATFLDRETAKIDALVAKKDRLIELLQEKRTAIITQAVTKGLDPNVPMKDSGVEWLGQIPAHWDVVRFKRMLRKPLQYGANEAAELSDPDLPRYIRITDIREDGTLRADTFKSLTEDAARPYLLSDGDLLFARSGATVGKALRYDATWGSCAHAGYLIRARLDATRAHSRFIAYHTASSVYWDWVRSNLIQATIQNVSAERYSNLVLCLPDINDQAAIVAFLDRETAKIDLLAAKVRQAIDLLKEYRTALISAAVTGKIDVREEG